VTISIPKVGSQRDMRRNPRCSTCGTGLYGVKYRVHRYRVRVLADTNQSRPATTGGEGAGVDITGRAADRSGRGKGGNME